MKIDIITLFPDMFTGPFEESIIKRAQDKNLVNISTHDLRKWSKDKHNSVDDRPFGGGKGMVLMVEPLDKAIVDLKNKDSRVILLSPQGRSFVQKTARDLSKEKHIIFISGHYEGFDERIRKHLIDDEVSIGNFVLTGGELPAMVITDAIVRLIPGVLDKEATDKESFSVSNVLDYPQYTRPSEYKEWKVPEVLLSGNHAEIDKWREKKRKKIQRKKRHSLV